ERDPSSKLDVVEQIQQMIVKITAQSPVKDAERLLELYLIEIETNLPDIVRDRFIAGRLWSGSYSLR
ncbi:MAG: hypothetical protein AAF383_30240, partial [Cyanobacteria bacterium P01_A01_bin.83]